MKANKLSLNSDSFFYFAKNIEIYLLNQKYWKGEREGGRESGREKENKSVLGNKTFRDQTCDKLNETRQNQT